MIQIAFRAVKLIIALAEKLYFFILMSFANFFEIFA
jgi:hypothetical protein